MITATEARRQYDRAKRLGWIPLFVAAASSRPWCSAADLMAIGSRETNLDPKYLKQTGDRGNGFGLMQVDKRYFPEWTASGKWRDPRECIEKGAEVLSQKRAEIIKSRGRVVNWRTSKGTRMSFTGAAFTDPQLRRIAIAGYNAGIAGYHHFSKAGDPDKGTTGSNYSDDVLKRSGLFAQLLKQDRAAAIAPAAQEVTAVAPAVDEPVRDNPEAAAVAVTPAAALTAAVSAEPATPVEGGAATDEARKVTAGSGSWIRSVLLWIGGLFTAASEHAEKVLGLSPDAQKYLIVAVIVVGVVYLILKCVAEWQVRRIAAEPTLQNVK